MISGWICRVCRVIFKSSNRLSWSWPLSYITKTNNLSCASLVFNKRATKARWLFWPISILVALFFLIILISVEILLECIINKIKSANVWEMTINGEYRWNYFKISICLYIGRVIIGLEKSTGWHWLVENNILYSTWYFIIVLSICIYQHRWDCSLWVERQNVTRLISVYKWLKYWTLEIYLDS